MRTLFSNFDFLPLRYIAKNPKFAHFPPFSATFNTLAIYLYHRSKENACKRLILPFFCSLLVFGLVFNVKCSLYVERGYILRLFWRVIGRPPQYQPTKVQLLRNLNFWFFEFFWVKFFLDFFRISLMTA